MEHHFCERFSYCIVNEEAFYGRVGAIVSAGF